MKNIKKIIISTFIVVTTILSSTISAKATDFLGGKATYISVGSTHNPGSGYAACNFDKTTHSSTAGLLVQIIEYEPPANSGGSYTSKVVAQKILKTSEVFGGYTMTADAKCNSTRSTTDRIPDSYAEASGTKDGCGNSESVDDIEITHYIVHWKAPTYKGSLQVFQNMSDQQRFFGPNKKYDLGDFSNGNLKYMIETKVLDQSTGLFPGTTLNAFINSINKEMGTNITMENYVKYYLKFEPIYRIFPSLASAQSKGPCANCSESTKTDMTDQCPSSSHTGTITTVSYNCVGKNSEGNCVNSTEDTSYCKTAAKPCKKKNEDTDSFQCVLDWTLTETTKKYGTNIDDQGKEHISGLGGNYVITAVESGNETYMKSLVVTASENDQDAIDDNAVKIDNAKDYYIGYNYKNALAMGDGYHKFNKNYSQYKLVKNIDKAFEEYNDNRNKGVETTVGMAVYNLLYVPKIESCKDVCGKYKNGTNEYLKCASNYCDTQIKIGTDHSATIDKRKCILDKDQCDYNPAKPVDCNNNDINYESKVNSLNNSKDPRDADTYCGFTNNAKTTSADTVKGAYYFCQREGKDEKELRSDKKDVYKYSDTSTYLNVMCMESASYKFTDLSNTIVSPGTAITSYGGKLEASRQCQVFFDYVSWKLDFASTHANDDTRKMILLNKLYAFNSLQNDPKPTYTINGSDTFGKKFKDDDGTLRTLNELEGSGITPVSALRITNDEDKTKVTTKVEEVVQKKLDKTGMEPYGNEIVLDIVNNEGKGVTSSSFTTNKKEDTLELVLDYNETEHRNKSGIGHRTANRYVYTSGIENEYSLPYVCTKDDGSGKVELSTNKSSTCKSQVVSTKTYDAERIYRTSPLATTSLVIEKENLGLEHKFITTAKINKNFLDGKSSDTNYFTENEKCPYKQMAAKCVVSYDYEETSGDYICYGPNTNGSAKITMTYEADLDEGITIKSYGLTEVQAGQEGKSLPNGQDTITITAKPMTFSSDGTTLTTSGSTRIVECVVETSDGKRYYGSKTFELLQPSSMSCTISASGTKYTITGGTDLVYATSDNKAGDGSLVWSELKMTGGKATVNNYSKDKIVYVAKKSGNSLALCGMYRGSSVEKCTNCKTDVSNHYDYTEVDKYCKDYYSTDIHNFQNRDECNTSCRNKSKCPKTCDLTQIKSWCTTNYGSAEYPNVEDCISDCYDPCTASNKYIYRPINEYNPFPYSEYSTVTSYTSGDRKIGKNWIAKEHYITDNANNNYTKDAEYVVQVGPGELSAIRKDSNSYVIRGIDPYTTRLTGTNAADCMKPGASGYVYKGYCSGLINDGLLRFDRKRGVA